MLTERPNYAMLVAKIVLQDLVFLVQVVLSWLPVQAFAWLALQTALLAAAQTTNIVLVVFLDISFLENHAKSAIRLV